MSFPTFADPPGTTVVNSPENFVGTWNATSNTPTLLNSGGGPHGGVAGNYYLVSVAGSTNIDGIASWTVDDRVVNTGSAWTRVPALGGTGTMASQNANAVAITGGTTDGQTLIGMSSGDKIQIPLATPNFAEYWRDTSGNVMGAIDGAGTLLWGATTLATLTLSTSLTYSGSLPFGLPESITLNNAVTIQKPQGVAPFPGYTEIVRDASGGIATMLDPSTNTQIFQNVQVLGSFTPPGNGLGVPQDAVDVTFYGASSVNAWENTCPAITTSSTSLSFYNYSGTATLTQNDSNSAILYLDGVLGHDNTFFQPTDNGATVYVQFDGGYTLGPVVMQWQDGQYALLQATGTITPQAAQSCKVSWPCLVAANAGQLLQVEGMGQGKWFSTPDETTSHTDTVSTFGTQPFMCQIISVTAPNAATVSLAFPFSWTAKPATLRWGPNSGNGVALAGIAALNAGKTKLYFPGPGNYWCWSCVSGNAAEQFYAADGLIASNFSAAYNATLWVGAGRVLAWAQGGKLLPKRCAPIGSDPTLLTDFWWPPGGTPRCAQLTGVNIMITGDSQAFWDAQNQGAWGQARGLWNALLDANPGKTVNVYNDALGATTLPDQVDPANSQSGANYGVTGGPSSWLLPTVPVGTHTWLAYTLDANQSGAGSPAQPDLVVQGDNGGNDNINQDIDSYFSWYNQVRAVDKGDGKGPPDVVWWSDIATIMSIYLLGAGGGGGGALPDPATAWWWTWGATGLHRQLASYFKQPCYDMAPGAARLSYGYDPYHPVQRSAPKVTATTTSTTPFNIPWPTQDLECWIVPTGAANDDAVWGSGGIGPRGLFIKTSPRRGGGLYLTRGNNGNLWYAHAIDGCVATTTCTIASGSTSLTVAAPTALQDTFVLKNWPQLSSAGSHFDATFVNKVIMTPTQPHSRTQRNFIAYDYDANNVRLFNPSVDAVTRLDEAWGNTATACTISGTTLTVGGTIAGTWGGSHSTGGFTATANDQCVSWAGGPDGVTINQQLTGTPGGAGTYQLNSSPGTVGSPTAMTSMLCTVGGVHFHAGDNYSTPDVVFYLPDGTLFNTKVAYGGYTSPTQVTLKDPAPDAQLAAGVAIPVFIGQMAPGFTDSGISLASAVNLTTLRIGIRRNRLILGLLSADATHVFNLVNTRIVRNYGVPFNVRLDTPGGTMTWAVSNVWLTRDSLYTPQRTPWQVRGWRTSLSNGSDLGGAAGHPGADASRYVDAYFENNIPILR